MFVLFPHVLNWSELAMRRHVSWSLPWSGTFSGGLSNVARLNEHIHMRFISVCLLPLPLSECLEGKDRLANL